MRKSGAPSAGDVKAHIHQFKCIGCYKTLKGCDIDMPNNNINSGSNPLLTDYGPRPFVINIEDATKQNGMFRTALWTGAHLQLVLMSIRPGESIGLEVHPEHDQFIRIEQGQGVYHSGRHMAQPDQYRCPTAQALYALRAARACARHHPCDKGGCGCLRITAIAPRWSFCRHQTA